MRIFAFLSMIFFSIGCNQFRDKSSDENNLSKLNRENFNLFFENFKKDSIFQVSRIDKPLILESIQTTNDLVENKLVTKKMIVNHTSFDEIDWNVELLINSKKIARDTVSVELQGVDTGLFFEHYFVNRDGMVFI